MKNPSELISRLEAGRLEAGCDEAGRGPLAGPVYAAAVIMPEDFRHPLLDDSKKMTEKARDLLRPIIEKEAIAFSVRAVSASEIDEINILNASIAGMQEAVMDLAVKPEFLLIDGNRFRPFSFIAALPGSMTSHRDKSVIACCDTIPYSCMVKGDGKFISIAAASVLAKTYRDEFMRTISAEYPEYGWDRNMGYPTKQHIEAIRKYGLTPYHRTSFHLKEFDPVLF